MSLVVVYFVVGIGQRIAHDDTGQFDLSRRRAGLR
jgi:hypothetical protein